jgi:SAM-dependent methyltransferase
MIVDSLRQSLDDHLDSWGLKRFSSDDEYFAWQRQALSQNQLTALHRCIELKRQGTVRDEVSFYDATAHPDILPVLYSQRYDYYAAVGLRVAARIEPAQTILDFGCGVGILTTLYARQYPDKQFVGIDRSPFSIARAEHHAELLHLGNVRFECRDVVKQPLSDSYDLIIATHALLQAEHDPGLPSRDWRTFERGHDPQAQQQFEERTGIDARLNQLSAAVAANGRMMVFEKTRQLARRVPFQRALGARGFCPLEKPEPIRYSLVEEVIDDGPLYVLGRRGSGTWDESPDPDEAPPFERAGSSLGSSDPTAPLYENHWPSAQREWETFTDRLVMDETTRQESDGRQMHVELGITAGLSFLYCANTFDQRQLVVMRSEQRKELEHYYAEIVSHSF